MRPPWTEITSASVRSTCAAVKRRVRRHAVCPGGTKKLYEMTSHTGPLVEADLAKQRRPIVNFCLSHMNIGQN